MAPSNIELHPRALLRITILDHLFRASHGVVDIQGPNLPK